MITDKIPLKFPPPQKYLYPSTLNLHALSPKHKPHCKNKQTKDLAKQNKITKKRKKEKKPFFIQLSFSLRRERERHTHLSAEFLVYPYIR